VIIIKINNETLHFPTKWEEVTYGQYIRIMSATTKAELICILLNQEYESLKNKTVVGLEDLFTAARFTDQKPTFSDYYPQVGHYKIPTNSKGKFDIRFESLGQFEDMRSVMVKIKPDEVTSLILAYGKSVSIYLQKIRDKEYDSNKVHELEAEIKSFPACEIIGLGQFFFLKLMILSNGTKASSLRTSQKLKKSKPVSKSSAKRSARTRR
jgi:hypothetical protein